MKTRKHHIVALAVIIAVLLLLAGCGGGGDGDAPANRLPRADAGADLSVAGGSSVTLDGSGSLDPDGSIAGYQWAQTSGTEVSLSNADRASASFVAPQVDMTVTLTFRLTVTDDDGATASNDVSVTIQPAGPGEAFVLDMSRLGEPGFRLR